ncbi:FAD/FMN-containing dehydrogenase [Natronocella acetinitrilica]|uniref:FAD/FMN-containing dehydrogenase n=1 Tax=Natronocella acetinitrilica TaxID=414046 RepID=A0AAE3KCS6_9GAMM|nr:FAD-binding oxidoreductase [Natronocella acetinitrilica]MCP1675363.1 FAD/FMN-containing dehydrogenase [Natronocella acetinitrilica]
MRQTLNKIRTLLGPAGWVETSAHGPYLKEWRGLYGGVAAAVVRPGSTEEVATVLRLCNQAGIGVVPQGGNTGLCGGAAPDESGRQIILSLERLHRVREIDTDNNTLTVEAGCTLAAVQQAAADAGRLFPLSLAAAAQTQIGGALATNAGGINVLHYGNTRALALGLEVVLADGRIWHGLRGLRKDNAGYDLRDLFIGSEGSLGIITAGVFQLFPQPGQQATAIVGLEALEPAPGLLVRLREATADRVVGCELMSRFSLETALKHTDGCDEPLPRPHPWYLLLELADAAEGVALTDRLQAALAAAEKHGQLAASRVAVDRDDADALWRIRKSIPAGQKGEGASIKHDISVPVSRIPAFVEEACRAVEERLPGVRPCAFGHLGDGNIHFNLSQPRGMDGAAFLARWDEFNQLVHDIVTAYGGSIAAEHGIGQLKRDTLVNYGDPVGLELMRSIKQALDPRGIMNPGKVL